MDYLKKKFLNYLTSKMYHKATKYSILNLLTRLKTLILTKFLKNQDLLYKPIITQNRLYINPITYNLIS